MLRFFLLWRMRPKLKARKRRPEEISDSDTSSPLEGPSTSSRQLGDRRRQAELTTVGDVLSTLHSALTASLEEELATESHSRPRLISQPSERLAVRLMDEPTPPASPNHLSKGPSGLAGSEEFARLVSQDDKGKRPMDESDAITISGDDSVFEEPDVGLFEDEYLADLLVGDSQTHHSDCSSIVQEIPAFLESENTSELRRAKLQKFFDSLAGVKVSDEVIRSCIMMAKTPHLVAGLGVSNFAEEILPEFITNDPRFWLVLVKVEMEENAVDLNEYNQSLQGETKITSLA